MSPLLLDLRPAQGKPTGAGAYMLGLAGALANVRPVIGLLSRQLPAIPAVSFPVTWIAAQGPLFSVLALRQARATGGRLIATSHVAAALAPRRAVPVFNDLVPLMFPDKHSRRAAAAARLTDRLATRASVVIAISQTTQADVVRLLSADPARICVVRPGTPELLDDGNADGARRRELGIEGDYVLVLGTLEPRKNLVVLVEAFGNSRFDGRLRLVIAGKLGWQAGRVLPGIEPLVRTGTAVTPGYVSDAQRAALYRGALCLAFPSIYEGFGLPILEAMAYGTPVIASTAPACVEVLGDAGLLVDPGDPGAWTRAIRTLASDSALRASLSSTGRQRAALFDWTASVMPLLARLDGSG